MEEVSKKIGMSVGLKITIGILVGLVVALGAVAAVYTFGSGSKDNKATSTTTVVAGKTVTNRIFDEGVTWIKPVKLSDLGLFVKNPSEDEFGGVSSIDYYKVGEIKGTGDIIDAIISFSPGGFDVYRIVKQGDAYHKVTQNTQATSGSEQTSYTEKGLTADEKTVFKSLLSDKTITKGQTKLTYAFNAGIAEEEGFSDGEKVGETVWGDFYLETGREIDGSNGIAKIARYYIKLNDSSRAYYTVSPTFMRDDGTLDISWSNEDKKGLEYGKVATDGCGGAQGTFPYISAASALADKEQVASNAKVYFVSNENSDMIKFGYAVYKMGAVNDPKPIGEFINNLGIVTWIDDYGSPISYMNTAYKPNIECGKPVVYLYPTETQKVSVKVGANITKSEPDYKEGWEVIASPSGLLTLNNKTYPYLFWEGIGHGPYPMLNSGSVVSGQDAVATIKSQMAYMGFNGQEIADFIDFWGPKMPDSKYVRLTWLQNELMDKLAPMKVSPRPQSVIRAFLDFAPLDAFKSIPTQTLKQYSRDGFTAVEWGGLLSQ